MDEPRVPDSANDRPSKVEIVSREVVFDDFFTIETAILRHATFSGGMTREVKRLALLRGDAVACLPYDPGQRQFFFVEQFRWPPWTTGEEAWLTEIPAGMVSSGEDPADSMARELREETGLVATNIEHLYTYYSTPGGSTERIFLYLAEVDGAGAAGRIAGEASETEDIRVTAVPFEEAFAMAREGRISDGKTLLALLAFRDRKGR
jgi:ADP-ribose pyrophosphatase